MPDYTVSMLRALMSCALVCLAPATAIAEGSFFRLGVAIEGPRKLTQAADGVVDAALGSVGLADPVRPDAMRKGASRLRVHGSWTTSTARQVGRAVHVTHVAVIRLASRTNRGDKQVFAELTLHDVFNERVLYHQSYFLPDGQLTESMAQTILARVRALVESGRDDAAPSAEPAAAPAASSARMRSHDIDTESKSGHEHGSSAADGDVEVGANGEEVGDTPALADYAHWSIGPMLGLRHAWLNSNGQDAALCYCNNGGFHDPMPGVDGRFILLFDPAASNFGIDVQGFIEYASANVTADTQHTVAVQQIFWRAQAALVYRFNLPADVSLRAELGYAFTRYALSHGAFPSLSYGAPSIGLHLAAPLGTEHVNLEVGSAFLAFVFPGANARLLGNPNLGLGTRVSLGLRFALGPLDLVAGTAYDYTRVTFGGTTTLTGVVNLTDATLYDEHLDVFLRLGSRF